MEDGVRSKNSLAVDGEGVFFRFGGRKSVPVLNGLDISVEKGIIYGLLGPSGCGKTTLLRCIVGRHQPSSGTIKIFGKSPGHDDCTVPGPGVGFMPQELALYPEITMKETLTYFGRLYQMDRSAIKERISFLTSFLDIPDKNKLIKHLSGGQQRRVSFAVALIHKPPLLMLDEPTVGVDPLLRRSIWKHLQKLASTDSITIIITTHYVEEARQAHVVGLMRDGRLLAETNPEVLIDQYNALTLEDVFLKLCVKDSEAIEAASADELNNFDEEPVWVKRKPHHTKYNAVTSINGYEQYETVLLNNSRKPVIDISRKNDCASYLNNVWHRMRALNHKNFVRLKRNIPLVFFQVFVPVFQVIVFCLCVGGEPFDIPMAIVNQETDPSGKSNAFLQTISSTTFIQNNFTNLSLALESVERGENWGVLYIPETFTDSMINRYLEGIAVDNETIQNSTIKMYLDMTNQQVIATIQSKIMGSFLTFARQTLNSFSWNPDIALPPIVLGKPVYGTIHPDFTEFMAPGMILGITYIMAVGLSAMAVIIEKKEGLLDRSWFAGVRSWEVMFSMLFSLFVTMLLQVVLVLVLTFKAFSIPCRGPLIWVVIAVLLTGLEGMSYGLFISSIVNDENIAMMIAMGSFYPNLLLSGIIWPVEAMPYYLRQFSYCLPLTLIANSMRSILSRGWTITDHGIWDGFLVCLAWIFPVILIASLFFRYKK
ncbi:ABC transporter G family member 20-like [Argiope bruennichi]|uniref:ABC transporter G family member 20-like n=1 Tax=Argiope bruennichi TaxID=94029 RepID=UPI002494B3AA|nr:ABC transporter G family member 20-like [Argiope bruennichi]